MADTSPHEAHKARLAAALELIQATYKPHAYHGEPVPPPPGGSYLNLAIHGDWYGAPFIPAFTAGDELVREADAHAAPIRCGKAVA